MAKTILNDVNVDSINVGNIYPSNQYGEFEIIERYSNHDNGGRIRYTIKFLQTGTIKTNISQQQIREGTIRDEYYPYILGVACMGNTRKREYTNGPTKRSYAIWMGMIRRCYDPSNQDYKTYGKLGVIVCDRWLCFENFENDLPFIPGYDEWLNNVNEYNLDKDYLQQGVPHSQKVYSPTTCMFITKYNNAIQMNFDYRGNNAGIGFNTKSNGDISYVAHANGSARVGTYDSFDAAVNARNRVLLNTYNNDVFLNPVENYMNYQEILSHYIGKDIEDIKEKLKIEMCNVIMREMCKIIKD